MEIVNEKDKASKDGVKYMIRGPHIDWGVITLEPNQVMAKHLHQEVEETFYIMTGTVTFLLQDKEMDAPAGTALRMSPNEHHGLKNKTNTQAKLVFMKDIYRPNDKVAC